MTVFALDAMPLDSTARSSASVLIGPSFDVLQAVRLPATELALWQRPNWACSAWLNALPPDALPTCRLTLQPHEAECTLHAVCDANGTPRHPARDAWVADMAALVAVFASLTDSAAVQMRLDVVSHNGCRRWHRDCVPLRLISTCRGPGTQWVWPEHAPMVMAQPDDDASCAQAMVTGDVAVFKGCGWPGQAHDGGIVHRSPRISGSGLTRLVLVLDLPATSG